MMKPVLFAVTLFAAASAFAQGNTPLGTGGTFGNLPANGNVLVNPGGGAATTTATPTTQITNGMFITTPPGVSVTLNFGGCSVTMPGNSTVQIDTAMSCSALQQEMASLSTAGQTVAGTGGGAGAGGVNIFALAGFGASTFALDRTIKNQSQVSGK